MFLGITISISINYKNWYLAVLCILAALVLLIALKKRVKEVLYDERDYIIAGKAARLTISIYAMICAVLGIILYIIAKENLVLFGVSNTLLYSACFLIFLNSILFKIYEKKNV